MNGQNIRYNRIIVLKLITWVIHTVMDNMHITHNCL